MTVDVYADLCVAWKERMRLLSDGEIEAAVGVWGAAYKRFYGDDRNMIQWVYQENGGPDCVVAGTMYFEDTRKPDDRTLVRVPK